MWKLPVKVLFVLLMSQQLRKRGATRLWPEQKVLNSCLSLWRLMGVLAKKQGPLLMTSPGLLQSLLRCGLLLIPDLQSDLKYRKPSSKVTFESRMQFFSSRTLSATLLVVIALLLLAPVIPCPSCGLASFDTSNCSFKLFICYNHFTNKLFCYNPFTNHACCNLAIHMQPAVWGAIPVTTLQRIVMLSNHCWLSSVVSASYTGDCFFPHHTPTNFNNYCNHFQQPVAALALALHPTSSFYAFTLPSRSTFAFTRLLASTANNVATSLLHSDLRLTGCSF
jgi:hypothetical protein